jgi:hypothetical protein
MRGATPPPQYVFMAWCLVKHRDDFIFIFTFTSGVGGVRDPPQSTVTQTLSNRRDVRSHGRVGRTAYVVDRYLTTLYQIQGHDMKRVMGTWNGKGLIQ